MPNAERRKRPRRLRRALLLLLGVTVALLWVRARRGQGRVQVPAPPAAPATPAAPPRAEPERAALPTATTEQTATVVEPSEPGAEEASEWPGSARPRPDGSAPGPEYTIKAKLSSRLFHPPTSPYYARTKADVWFRTVEEARAAGFTEYRRRSRS